MDTISSVIVSNNAKDQMQSKVSRVTKCNHNKMKPFTVPAGYEDFVSSKEVLLDEIHRDLPRKDDLADGFVYVRMYSLTTQSFLERDDKLSSMQLIIMEIESMKQILEELKVQVHQLSSSFRWQGEPLSFHLTITSPESPFSSHRSRLPSACLFAAVNYNDSIEDEWFIVYILLELTKRLKQHNLCIQVTDNDGEFLLIESADYLDSWIAPETSANRVWIKDGAVHIIPPDASNSMKGNFSITSALAYLQDANTAKNSLASKSIHRVIAARTTAVFPEKVEFLHHNVVCLLPYWTGYLLQQDANLLSKATYAFFNTEAELLSKAVNRKSSSMSVEFSNKHQELVAVVLPWTKAQYAQATFKKFKVPRKYHDLMRRAATANSTKVNHAFDLGCRVLCGIDLVYQAAVESRHRQLQLRGLLEVRQQQLLATNSPLAAIFTADTPVIVTINNQDASDNSKLAEYLHALQPNDADRVDTLLSSCYVSDIEDSETATFKSIIEGTVSSDSEQWLYMEPDDFDKLIKETVERTRGAIPSTPSDDYESPIPATRETGSEADKTSTEMEHLQAMVDGFKTFLTGTSEISGIESAPVVTQQQTEINWDEDMDMSYLETTLQNAKLAMTQDESAVAVEAAVNSVATKVMTNEDQNGDDDMQTDSDDEDDEGEDQGEEDDEEMMFGPSSNQNDHEEDSEQMDDEDFEDDDDENNDDDRESKFNMTDFQVYSHSSLC